MPFVGLSLLLQILCAVHVMKTGRPYYWIFIVMFAPMVGIIGAMQAAEGMKLIAGVGASLAGRLLLLDALTMSFREVRIPRDPHCPVCSTR